MTNGQFEREKNYGVVMAVARKWDIDAAASAVEAFDFKPLSRSEVEKRISEMREHDG